MRAAILCGGKSLLRTWSRQLNDSYIVIAINDAAVGGQHLGHIDWNASADACQYKKLNMLCPLMGICGMDKTVQLYRRDSGFLNLPEGLKSISWDELPWTTGGCGIGWSAVGAILLAEHIGCEYAHVYGMDLSGDNHLINSSKTGGQMRWKREINALKKLRQQTDQRGFNWSRITPYGETTGLEPVSP